MPEGIPRDLVPAAALVASATVFYLVPSPVIYLPALLILAILSWRRLDLALTIVVLFVPLFMLPKHLGSKEFAPSEIFLILDVVIAGTWLLSSERRAQLAWGRLIRSPFLLPAVLFLVAGLLSTILAADRHQALQAYREVILEPVIYFGLLLLVQARVSGWAACFGAVIGAGLIVGIVGLVQRATHHGLTVDTGSTILKVRSVYGSPDNVGLLYDRVLPVWLATALLVRLGRTWRLVWYLAGAVLVATLIFSYSRGAWAAVGIAAIAMLALSGRKGRWIASAAVILLVAAAAVKGPAIVRALSAGHNGTVQERLYIWHSAERMIADRPIFGIGPDNFVHYYAPTPGPHQYLTCSNGLGFVDPKAVDQPCLSHPHDEILDFYLSTGLAGLLAFVWLEAVFWSIFVQWFRRTQGMVRVMMFGAAGAMLAALVHGLVDNGYFLMDLAVIFWLLCGFMSFVAWEQPSPASAISHEVALTEPVR